MNSDNFFESVKRNLNGNPGQPIVLGVCKTLAKRFHQEVWLIRLATIVLGAFFTFFTLAAYIVLGLFMTETSDRTKSLFEGLGIYFRELTDKIGSMFGDSVNSHRSTRRDR
jgi:phage shock protein PspC (stress-responsive transcriptional regulator)